MAHLSEGALRRMFDDPDARTGSDAQHLESCGECGARFEKISAEARSIATLLAVPEAKIDAARALARVRSAPAARPALGFRLPVMRPFSRPVMLAAAAVVVTMGLVATAIAQGANVFAPTTVTPVPVTVADLEALSQLSQYGTITWTKQPQLQVVTSAADATSVTGLKMPNVGKLPAGISTTVTYGASSQATAVFTFSASKAAAAAAAHGKTLPAMPAGMDGAQLSVTAGPAVAEVFGNLKKPQAGTDITQADLPQLVVVASSAPTATSTQVTVKELESYLLTQPGISGELAAAIKAIGDPSTTLPIPVPIEFATSSKVSIHGQPGVALGDNTGLGAAVIWEKNGVVYGVAGTVKQSDAVNIANNLS